MTSSAGLMRNIHGLPRTPDSSVILALDEIRVIIGIPACWMIGMVARVAELQCAPKITGTLASTSLLATLTASDGLQRLSSTIDSSLRPSTPPLALISSIARSMPQRSLSAAIATGPVTPVLTPITMFCAAAPDAVSAARAAAAITDRRSHPRISLPPDALARPHPPHTPLPSGEREGEG